MKTSKIKQDPLQGDNLYERAYSFYQAGHYKKSTQLFKLLTLESPGVPAYWISLGHSLKMEKRKKDALDAYLAGSFFKKDDPELHFHIADCLYETNRKQAIGFLKKALALTKDDGYKRRFQQILFAWEKRDD